jgi:hypothetical protein
MASNEDRIKVPDRSKHSHVEKALAKAPRDGSWHILIQDMGMTSAEQTARGYNVTGAKWQFGYTLDNHSDGSSEIVSTLWVRYVG